MISFYKSGYTINDLKTLLHLVTDAQKKLEKDCKKHCFYCGYYCENEIVCIDLYKFSYFLKKLLRDEGCSDFTET